MRNKRAEREEIFAREYIIDLNGSEAAKRAGYASKSARITASRLLTKANVKALIAKLTEKKFEKLEITGERVLREIALCAYANMADYTRLEDHTLRLDLSKTTREQRAAIAELTEDATGGTGDGERRVILRTKLKLWNKLQSLELLARHFKLLTDKVELDATANFTEALARILARKRGQSNG